MSKIKIVFLGYKLENWSHITFDSSSRIPEMKEYILYCNFSYKKHYLTRISL